MPVASTSGFRPDELNHRQAEREQYLALPPTCLSVELSQASDFSNACTGSERLDMGNFTEDVKVH